MTITLTSAPGLVWRKETQRLRQGLVRAALVPLFNMQHESWESLNMQPNMQCCSTPCTFGQAETILLDVEASELAFFGSWC